MLDLKALFQNKVEAQAQKCDNMASCRSVHFSSLWRASGFVCFLHRVRKSRRQSQWCFEGVFHPPFSCQMHSMGKGSIAFEIFFVVTLVTPPFSNRLAVQRSDEPLIGSTDQWNYGQTESSLCLQEGGGIWTYTFAAFNQPDGILCCNKKPAVLKQPPLGTKSHCYTMVLLSPALSTYWKKREKPC